MSARRRRMAALALWAFSYISTRWSGWYGVLVVPPVWEAALFATVTTVVTLRARVLVGRYLR